MQPTTSRTILVTTALPYANGPLHFGHLVEQVQADIWVRFQRLRGHTCYFLSGIDAHGTAIMLNAEKRGVTPEQLIEDMRTSHAADLGAFNISLDLYSSTHTPENEALATQFFHALEAQNAVAIRAVRQAFDTEKQLFLADRYIKGDCPHCQASDQYGDHCERCGATYAASELGNPYSVLSQTTPIEKASDHFFFKLSEQQAWLSTWLQSGTVQPEVLNKLQEWLSTGLQDWDISRDAPYFGIKIPGQPDKYFYVWLDAPIGYISATQHLCQSQPSLKLEDIWDAESHAELYHFIGKDIINFHTLFWPAMLKLTGHRLPTAVWAHGFLTVDGQKMSKSRGTFITARHYLDHLDPDYLRYYFATKLGPHTDDMDLNFADFAQRVNTDLVGKYVNIASRCARFITDLHQGRLAKTLWDAPAYQQALHASTGIAQAYEQRDFGRAVRDIMHVADQTNQMINDAQPWTLAKADPTDPEVQAICSQGLNLFRLLTVLLQPILPDTASRALTFLNLGPQTWADLQTPLLDHAIQPFQPLLSRISVEQLTNIQAPASNASTS